MFSVIGLHAASRRRRCQTARSRRDGGDAAPPCLQRCRRRPRVGGAREVAAPGRTPRPRCAERTPAPWSTPARRGTAVGRSTAPTCGGSVWRSGRRRPRPPGSDGRYNDRPSNARRRRRAGPRFRSGRVTANTAAAPVAVRRGRGRSRGAGSGRSRGPGRRGRSGRSERVGAFDQGTPPQSAKPPLIAVATPHAPRAHTERPTLPPRSPARGRFVERAADAGASPRRAARGEAGADGRRRGGPHRRVARAAVGASGVGGRRRRRRSRGARPHARAHSPDADAFRWHAARIGAAVVRAGAVGRGRPRAVGEVALVVERGSHLSGRPTPRVPAVARAQLGRPRSPHRPAFMSSRRLLQRTEAAGAARSAPPVALKLRGTGRRVGDQRRSRRRSNSRHRVAVGPAHRAARRSRAHGAGGARGRGRSAPQWRRVERARSTQVRPGSEAVASASSRRCGEATLGPAT